MGVHDPASDCQLIGCDLQVPVMALIVVSDSNGQFTRPAKCWETLHFPSLK